MADGNVKNGAAAELINFSPTRCWMQTKILFRQGKFNLLAGNCLNHYISALALTTGERFLLFEAYFEKIMLEDRNILRQKNLHLPNYEKSKQNMLKRLGL
jgi:hypothetical protein